MKNTKIALHLGGHRTASTSLQTALDRVQSVVEPSEMVSLTPSRPGRRAGLTVRKLARVLTSTKNTGGFWLGRRKRKQAIAMLDELLIDKTGSKALPDRLIISDETLLGRAFGKQGQSIYPFSKAHLQSIKCVFPYKIDEIHLTTRSYASFLRSVYAMRAVYGKNVPRYDDIGDELTKVRKSWPNLVDEIVSIFPDAKVIISAFENADLEARLSSLIGGQLKIENLSDFIPEPVNLSPSLEAINEARERTLKPAEADEIVKQFGNGTSFDPIDQELKEGLAKRYEQDLELIKSNQLIGWLPLIS